MVSFSNTERVVHVYDPEPSLHCFERLRIIVEAFSEGVLAGNDESLVVVG